MQDIVNDALINPRVGKTEPLRTKKKTLFSIQHDIKLFHLEM